MSTRRTQSGFTLLELLISLSIFALISVMAYTGLNTTLQARDTMNRHSERLSELQRAFTIMQRDLTQAVDRDVRDRFGDRQPALLNELGELTLTRGGHPNPIGFTRSSLQRVTYRLDEEGLIRQQWLTLDASLEPESHETVLLTEVDDVEFRFLDDDLEWGEQWPPLAPDARALPRAIAVRFEFSDLGEVERLFLLPF